MEINLPVTNEHGTIGQKQIILQADVIDLALPLLLSRASLIAMGALLDFSPNRLVLPGNVHCQLKDNLRGHSELTWNPISLRSMEIGKACGNAYPVNTLDPPISQTASIQNNDQQQALPTQIVKLHRHLGHADVPTLWRIAKQAGFKNDRQSIN